MNKKISELTAELRDTTNTTIVAQRDMIVQLERSLKKYQYMEMEVRTAYRMLVNGEVDVARTRLLAVLMKWPSN